LKAVVKLAVVLEGSLTPNSPIGPRLQREPTLPLWSHYEANGGYYFEPTSLAEAQEAADQLNEYIQKNITNKRAKKKP
jgi:hypothetical protein